jgi:hypothetical protein
MVSKNSMSDVDESVDESDSSNKDPTTLDESDEDEVEHDLFNSLMMKKFHFEDCCLI